MQMPGVDHPRAFQHEDALDALLHTNLWDKCNIRKLVKKCVFAVASALEGVACLELPDRSDSEGSQW